MKRNKKSRVGFSIFGFMLFFFTILITSTGSIFTYYFVNKATDGNIYLVVLSCLAIIIFGAMLCSLSDIVRRRIMVEKPVKKILEATEKIASGDFSVKLEPLHEYSKYDQYDLIFENINILTAELSKNEILKNDFISNVSHEIKTPLSVIQNYAKALKGDNLSEAKKSEYLSGLVVQTQKLSELVSNILKLNKLENQELIPEMEELDLAETLRVCVIGFENLIEKKNIKLELDIEEIKVVSSESLLELVFNNLISNAIKFTDDGGEIKVSLKGDNKFATVKVTDSGIGISNEVGQHIFEKFYQGDSSRASEGNGLGLALVKKVIDILGGEIAVESKVGKGSTFSVKIKKG